MVITPIAIRIFLIVTAALSTNASAVTRSDVDTTVADRTEFAGVALED